MEGNELFLSLIICTYNRPVSLCALLRSLETQSRRPDEVIIVDGSTDDLTERAIADGVRNLHIRYFHVNDEQRGLTKQRNFGLVNVGQDADIIAFLDDDVILDPKYFQSILLTYRNNPEAIGVGGYIVNEVKWKFLGVDYKPKFTEFYFEGWVRKEQSRMLLRKIFGLYPETPGQQPGFSHGLSVGYFPPSDKIYKVDFFMGGVASYKKEIFDKITFSEYFQGYGLYEDLEFTLRASKIGPLYLNTASRLEHHHHPGGRPNSFRYGIMVVRNGWYVWRINNPTPAFFDRIKWWVITTILIIMRFFNGITGPSRMVALKEALGRTTAAVKLIFDKPV